MFAQLVAAGVLPPSASDIFCVKMKQSIIFNKMKKYFILFAALAGMFFLAAGLTEAKTFFEDSGGNIGGWDEQSVFGREMEAAPVSVSSSDAGSIVVCQNLSGNIVMRSGSAGGWDSWREMNGEMKGQAAIDAGNDSFYIAVRGLDDGLWFNEGAGDNWSGWNNWGGKMTGNPVVAKTDIGVEVALRGLDGHLWTKRRKADGGFVDWRQIGELPISGELAAVDDESGIIILARDLDNKVNAIERNAQGGWGKWEYIGGAGISDPGVQIINGKIYVAVVGLDGALWYAQKENGGWLTWKSLGGNLSAMKPVIISIPDGLAVFGLAPNGQVWFRVNRSGQWKDWEAAPGTAKYFNILGDKNGFMTFETASDKKVYRQNYSYSAVQTSSDFTYRDYSIDDVDGGGKRLSLHLANQNYKVKVSYTAWPGQKVIAKNIDLSPATSGILPANHANGTRAGVYISAGSNEFRIGNDYIERKLVVSQGVLSTTEIYNKITGRRYPVVSDEFGFRVGRNNEITFLDIERMSLGEKCQWSRGVADPLIYSDIFLWTDNPVAVPKLGVFGGGQYLIWRFNYSGQIGSNVKFSSYLGAARNSRGLADFRQYLTDLKKPENKFFFTYNSWWTTSFAYSENDILGLIDKLGRNLIVPYGAKIDSFTLDEGWANPQSIWKINYAKLPTGFSNINSRLRSYGMSLGLWISPGAVYSTLNKDWAAQNGYPTGSCGWTGKKIMCFGEQAGKKNYAGEFKNTLVGYLTNYNIANVKFDYWLTCRENASDEAESFFNAWDYLKKTHPSTKYELNILSNPTAYLKGDAMKEGSDDYPSGILPALNYKDAYLTTRDRFWLDAVSGPIPASLAMTYGIIIQTTDDWRNDAIANLMRGNGYVPLYVNPNFMKTNDWKDLAKMMKWARANQSLLLSETRSFGGDPKNGEVYGISHTNPQRNEAYVYLRNPVIDERNYTLNLSNSLGLAGGRYTVKIIYPYRYIHEKKYSSSEPLNINLKGFEVLVLHIAPATMAVSEPVGVRYGLFDNSGVRATRIFGRGGTNNAYKLGASAQNYNLCDTASVLEVNSSVLNKSSGAISGSFKINSGDNYSNQLTVLVNSSGFFDTNNVSNYSFSIDKAAVKPAVKKQQCQRGP